MFNVNNISAILWHSVLLVEETKVPVENRSAASHRQTLSQTLSRKIKIVRNDMDVNEHDRLSNMTLRLKLKYSFLSFFIFFYLPI